MPEISHKLSEVAWCAFRDSNKPALYNQIRDALEAYEAAKNETAEASVTNALERLDAIASYQPRPNMKRELRELAELFRQALAKPASEPADGAVRAWRDVLAERRRQVEVEGWSTEHDDQHSRGEMAKAAACYAAGTTFERNLSAEERRNMRTKQERTAGLWPWERQWWKPGENRSNLVKAGALILAEIERLDRKTVCQTCDGHGLIGGWRVGDDYDAEPCPDCATLSAPASSSPAEEAQAGAIMQEGRDNG